MTPYRVDRQTDRQRQIRNIVGGCRNGCVDLCNISRFLFRAVELISCCIQVSVTVNTICPSIECRPPIRVSECGLSDDFEALLDRQQLCDVTISVLGGELHAHKAVLAGQCSRVHCFSTLSLTLLLPFCHIDRRRYFDFHYLGGYVVGKASGP